MASEERFGELGAAGPEGGAATEPERDEAKMPAGERAA